MDGTTPPRVRLVLDVVDAADADRGTLADVMADEVRRQLGPAARTLLVVRDVVPVD